MWNNEILIEKKLEWTTEMGNWRICRIMLEMNANEPIDSFYTLALALLVDSIYFYQANLLYCGGDQIQKNTKTEQFSRHFMNSS